MSVCTQIDDILISAPFLQKRSNWQWLIISVVSYTSSTFIHSVDYKYHYTQNAGENFYSVLYSHVHNSTYDLHDME